MCASPSSVSVNDFVQSLPLLGWLLAFPACKMGPHVEVAYLHPREVGMAVGGGDPRGHNIGKEKGDWTKLGQKGLLLQRAGSG